MAKKGLEAFMKYVFLMAALASILAVFLICVFLFAGGVPAMGEIGVFNFLLGEDWNPTDTPPDFGILSMIMGSVYVTLGAIICGVPIGVLTAIFLARFCPRPLYRLLKPATQLLAGIPSVVYGFFGAVVLVPFVRDYLCEVFGGNGPSIFTASVLLGVMILPTVIGVSEAAIRAVPESYYEGALALGASHERSVFFAVVPAASSGIMTSVILGTGRAIGETMAVIMVAGNQPRMPAGLFRGVRTMTANIVIEMGYSSGLHREALVSTGVVLFVFILVINLLFSIAKRRNKYD
jgi:phosphate transport system permease protein